MAHLCNCITRDKRGKYNWATMWLGSSADRVRRDGKHCFSAIVTFGSSLWVPASAASSQGTVSSVAGRIGGQILLSREKNVTDQSCGSVVRLAECSHGKREVLGSSSYQPHSFSTPVTYVFMVFKYLPQFSVMEILCLEHEFSLQSPLFTFPRHKVTPASGHSLGQ